MFSITKDEVRELLRGWNIKQLDELENTLGRELSDDAYKDMVFYIMGYADFSTAETLESFVDFAALTEHLTEDEIQKLKDYDKLTV